MFLYVVEELTSGQWERRFTSMRAADAGRYLRLNQDKILRIRQVPL